MSTDDLREPYAPFPDKETKLAIERLKREVAEASGASPQRIAAADAAWAAIGSDPELKRARQKLSMHEIRQIVRHCLDASVPAA